MFYLYLKDEECKIVISKMPVIEEICSWLSVWLDREDAVRLFTMITDAA